MSDVWAPGDRAKIRANLHTREYAHVTFAAISVQEKTRGLLKSILRGRRGTRERGEREREAGKGASERGGSAEKSRLKKEIYERQVEVR